MLLLTLAFITDLRAQWNQDPTIRETHWFGQYEYVDIQPGFVQRKINWSDNYIESTEIWRGSTGGGQLAHQPKTSYYSWLEHELRFSVANTSAWAIRGTNNTAYNPKQFNPDNGGGQGLRNTSGSTQNFYIHNLKAGDSYDVRYYLDGGSSESHITGSATGTATVSIPANAVIRNVVITLAEYQASDFKVEEVNNVSDITSSYAGYANLQTSNFGDLGYRYSFKHPGVLEDKHGAVPYMTMSFGNDNDMTFVRAIADVTYSYGSSTQVEPKMYCKNYTGVNYDPDPNSPSQPNDNGVYTVSSGNNAQESWFTQFFIAAPYTLPAGKTVHIHFEYRSDAEASVSTQTHGTQPGSYISNNSIGTFSFNSTWNSFDQDYTIQDDGWGSIVFNLNDNHNLATSFYFRNITLSIPERIENIGDDGLGAASIINEHNDLDPTDKHLQYPWTYKNNSNYQDPFSEEEIKDRFVGKEWSTFTAEEDPTHTVRPEKGSDSYNGEEYVYGDKFNSIWPLCGNFFYFFPEVDGLLEVEYYCEGSNEVVAFWYKQNENGDYVDGSGQPKTQFINTNSSGDSNTNGRNNYKLRVNVEKGGVYYLCSLPTNLHAQPIIRLKSYTFVPRFRVAPLYKVVSNTEVTNGNAAIQKVAEITGGPYTDLDGRNRGYGNNAYDLDNNTFTRNAEQEPRIKCLGNVVSAKAKIDYEGGKQYLSFSDIKFREGTNPETGEAYNPGGAVVAHVNNGMGQASFVLTIAYDAADAKWNDAKDTRVAATSGGKEVKHWDFYSGKGDYITKRNGVVSYNGGDTYTTEVNSGWDLGKYGEDDGTRYATAQTAWESKSKLFKETHKADGLTTDWEHDYVDVPNKKEPIFKSIYDMEADNADMIHETAGLVFFTEPNELGVYNENEAPTSSFKDRFIGLMGGGKLIIPRLKANDRVVIKMGCFGNADGGGNDVFEQKAVLWLTNAKDAKGTPIPENTDYIIGGSMPYDGEPQPHGEYHFIVNQTSTSDDTDFAIDVQEAGLLKIYSIDIYRNAANENADILTENSVTMKDGPEVVYTEDDTFPKDMEFFMRYSGYKEKKTLESGNVDQLRGNLFASLLGEDGIIPESNFKSVGSDDFPYNSVKIEGAVKKGDFGSFRADMTVKTKDDDDTYVTDYTPGNLAVGYLETMPYPYTWDFMDLLEIQDATMDDQLYIEHAIQNEMNASNLVEDYKGWVDDEGVHCLRNAPMNEPGILFANGGQLYGANKMFAEIAGIGFKRSVDTPEEAKLMNRSVGIHSGSLELNADEGMFHKLVLPKVPANGVVYVRATPIKNASLVTKCSVDGVTKKPFDKTIEIPMGDNKKDYVYIMKNNAEQDVELWLNGLSVQKIAVSTDFKKIGSTGYATESRDHIIDHTLTEFFTGLPIKAYYGKLSDDKKSVSLEKVEFLKAATAEGDATGCILHNETSGTSKAVNIIDGGFHLFVPDMHDKGSNNIDGNVLLAHTTDGNITNESGLTRYVLSNKWYSPGDDGKQNLNTDLTKVRFVKVDHSTGAKLSANSAYMELSKEAGAKIANIMLFYDESEEPSGEATGIVTVNHENEKKDVWYNLSGLPIEAPSKAGIYIRNGKKVVVK